MKFTTTIKALILALVFTFAAPPVMHGIDAGFFASDAHAAKRKHKARKMKTRRGSDAHALVVASARRHGVPVAFALRIARQESGVRCGRVGDRRIGGSYGPLQILNRTARSMFGVNAARLSCAAQTDLGMRHLKAAYRAARGNLHLAALKHNGGIGAGYRNRMATRYANAVVGGGKKHKRKRRG